MLLVPKVFGALFMFEFFPFVPNKCSDISALQVRISLLFIHCGFFSTFNPISDPFHVLFFNSRESDSDPFAAPKTYLRGISK